MNIIKKITILLATILCFTLFLSAPAFATNSTITPRWDNTVAVTASIVPSSSVYFTSVEAVQGITSISVEMTLYKKGFFGGYSEVDSYSGTTSTSSAYFSKTFSYSSNTTYRLISTITVIKNNVCETITTSTERTT